MEERRISIDILKGIAITAVVFYHMGVFNKGYLGVDIFFVINGFLVIPGLIKNIEEGKFRYFAFLKKKLMRLLPVLVVACLVCFFLGFIGMLPDNFENLSESVVASLFFSNNILSAITTKNYWDIVNNYKPLMHTWYLGILFEIYIFLPCILMATKKIQNRIKVYKRYGEKTVGGMDVDNDGGGGYIIVVVLTIFSLFLYFLPFYNPVSKFYYLPFRFFEFGLGGIATRFVEKKRIQSMVLRKIISHILLSTITVILVFGFILSSKTFLLLSICVLTGLFLIVDKNFSYGIFNFFSYFGTASYSIFIWHQVILAFWRCFGISNFSITTAMLQIFTVILISLLSYVFLENNGTKWKIKITVILTPILAFSSFCVYKNAGVVRDVPELGIYKNNIHRNMHAQYCDRVYSLDKDFEASDKLHVLIIGNSFARDFANIILESTLSDRVEISYSFDYYEKIKSRILESDFIFIYGEKENVPKWLWNSLSVKSKVFGIGAKNFGENNDSIYIRRFTERYFSSRVFPEKRFLDDDSRYKSSWKENYVNLFMYILDDKGTVPVFTESKKFISQDCRHLTKNGALYFAQKLPLDDIFKL